MSPRPRAPLHYAHFPGTPDCKLSAMMCLSELEGRFAELSDSKQVNRAELVIYKILQERLVAKGEELKGWLWKTWVAVLLHVPVA